MKKNGYVVVAACVMSMLLLGGCGQAAQEENSQESIQEEREEAPASDEDGQSEQSGDTSQSSQGEQAVGIMFEAKDLEGNVVTESIFTESRLTMVNVWATYCNPCLSEMPGLGELVSEYDQEQFQIIGIVSDVQEGVEEEAVEYAAALAEQTGADYAHLLLNQSLYTAMLSGVSAVPTTFFVDENGEVLDTVVGAMDKSSWKEKIDAFLEE